MDELVKETEKALDLDLDELSFKQIKGFFTAERPTEEKAQVVFEGIKKAVDLGVAIYKFLDKLDGMEDGQINCGQCIML